MKFGGWNVWCLLVLVHPRGSRALRDVALSAPEAVARGAPLRMRCSFDLEREELYSVKWYRGDHEFCRYSPRDVPPLKVFHIPGIDVVREESDATRLTLARATRTAAGRYVCEVSVDAPSFQTARVQAVVKVVDLPASGPEITGLRHRYRPGDRLRAECVSRDALPPANLSFYVNSEPAPAAHVWQRVERGRDQLMTAHSSIHFTLQPHHFVDSRLKLRCTATVYGVYLQSRERTAAAVRARARPSAAPDVQHAAAVYPVHRRTAANGAGGARARRLARLLALLLLPEVLR